MFFLYRDQSYKIKKKIKTFLMAIAYIFCYTSAYLSYPIKMGVSKEKKPAPGDYEFNLKL